MSITFVRTRDGRIFVLPTSWFEDYGDCLRVNFGIFHTKIYKGSIDVANTFNLINILKTAFVIVAVLFLVSAFQ